MINIKKGLIIFYVPLFLAVLSTAYADEFGCCSDAGAGLLTCTTERLVSRDTECCPKPESSFPSYYKSQQNPFGPVNYNECTINFFFPNKDCGTVDACALGCCCSELGGTIKSEAACKATNLTFYKGVTDCNEICATPECSDGIDNDNNGCADFAGGDLGCNSAADSDESEGTCIPEGVGCSDPEYVPKLSNLAIAPAKGLPKFFLNWQDECTAVSYSILRCKGSSCTNFVAVGTTNTNSFTDASDDLLFDTTYTYQVKAAYSLQTATPTITKTATLGSKECLGRFDTNVFCLNSTAYFCDQYNNLVPEGTKCLHNQFCIADADKAYCVSKINCNYKSANPFGLYYTINGCEANTYCFYDKSYTIANSCFGCDPSMACYDYKTQNACSRDNCKVGNCKWKGLAGQIGVGACVSTAEYNCKWCDKKGTESLENTRVYNEIFDFCTQKKSDLLSEGSSKCYYKNGISSNCNEVVCTDYSTDQCSNTKITHDEYNQITNPSSDKCGIKVCQNMDGICVKNADGDDLADCSNPICELDYSAPNTTILPIIRKGIFDDLIIQIYDRTSANSSTILRTSSDYGTFLCVEPCSQQGHPYNALTKSRKIIISNLNAYDGNNGSKLLSFSDGVNIIRYYSQDLAKNIEEVKKLTVEAYRNTTGPKIFAINVTGGAKILDKIYTNVQTPTIDVQFVEPAIVTFARLIDKKTNYIVTLQGNTELSTKVSFSITQLLPNAEYAFELNAKNQNNIFMDPPFSAIIVVDNAKPTLNITPSEGAVINTPNVAITLTFNKKVNLDEVKINSEDIKSSFATTDDKTFTSTKTLDDGNKKLEVAASDFANNKVSKSSLFVVDAYPTTIVLVKPKFGVSSSFTFDIVVATDNNADCRYSLDSNFEFEFMWPFTATGGTNHTISNFDKIANGDTSMHKLHVKCQDLRGIAYNSFSINADATPPLLKNAFAFPNPVIEKPSTTTLTTESDEPVICKFSSSSQQFGTMEGKFNGFDNNTFKIINRQAIILDNEGSYLYYVACQNKAGLNSETKQILINVDLSIPITITSHTPPYFNSTRIVLAIETNKKSQCKYSESDHTAQTGEIFGESGYTHTRQLESSPGAYTFYVVCKDQFLQKFSDVLSVPFTIDTSSPIILYVNDSSTLTNKTEFTWSTDSLRVKWHSVDSESRVSTHFYSLVDSGTLNVILNWTSSFLNNEWLPVTKPNGAGLNLVNGNKYFFRVKAQNIVGLTSNISESSGITIDTSLKPLNCTNGIKDEKETDVDCGGSCSACELGKKCTINIDCKTNFCNNGVCSSPRCDDNIKNADESDVDCGGSCKKCQNNKVCNANNDCESNYCSFGNCKPQESCSDGKFTPGESDIDCGGYCPTKCPEGKSCVANSDCEDKLKCISSLCKKCADNDKNCNGVDDGMEDSDGDGLPDWWEIQHGLNPNDPNDAGLDVDNDGLTNKQEYEVQKLYSKSTDPNKEDSDGDGVSDKEEIDKGTNPLDAKDFPKSNLTKIILYLAGIAVLLSGFGYLAYSAVTRRKVEKFEPRPRLQMQKVVPTQQRPIIPRRGVGGISREALRQREQQKLAERKTLFEAFGRAKIEKQKEEIKEAKAEKLELKEIRMEKKPHGKKAKRASKAIPKKTKEDVFKKLKEIARESKKKKIRR